MALVDLPLEELKLYKPERCIADDFQVFWQEKIKKLRSEPVNYNIEKLNYIDNKPSIFVLA